MTKQEIREAVADRIGKTHGNKAFVDAIRSGKMDEGLIMTGAFAASGYIRDTYILEKRPEFSGAGVED